jgi:hypothetical protein
VSRSSNEQVYNEGHAVAFMALLARHGGSVTFARDELGGSARGPILRRTNPDGTVTYRLEREEPWR